MIDTYERRKRSYNSLHKGGALGVFISGGRVLGEHTFSRGDTATFLAPDSLLTETTDLRDANYVKNPVTGLYERTTLLEGQRINKVRNPRAEGAVSGSPGTMPTNWGFTTGAATTLTREVVGTGTEDGIPYFDIRLSGTPDANGLAQLFVDGNTQIAGVQGEAWTYAPYVSRVGGALTNLTISIAINESDGTGTYLTEGGRTITPPVAPLRDNREPFTRTVSNVSTAHVTPLIKLSYTNGAAFDITLRIGAPQMEKGAFSTSMMLPPVGSPGDFTRPADSLSFPNTEPPQAMTMYARFIESGNIHNQHQNIIRVGGGAVPLEPFIHIVTLGGTGPYNYAVQRGDTTDVASHVQNFVPDIGDLVELRGVLYSDGSVQLHQSINGGDEESGTRSATLALPAAWGENITLVGCSPKSATKMGHVAVFPGDVDREQCRASV